MPAKKQQSEEFQRFTAVVDTLLSVPKDEIKRREEEYRQNADANPRKRGPKPKRNP
ncbi:MAG: hypothetical protein ACXW5U_22970 [Thermoanaerobaculia bacterium]